MDLFLVRLVDSVEEDTETGEDILVAQIAAAEDAVEDIASGTEVHRIDKQVVEELKFIYVYNL
jgi:hypothetical protein